jgi:hypothetical protein
MRMTRRKLAVAVMAPAAALAAQTSAPKPPAQTPPADSLESARRQIRNNAAALARFDLPMPTEPAFRFEA